MTDNYRDILDFITTHKADNEGKSPTYEEIKAFLKAPTRNMVTRAIVNMERQGLISRNVGRAQSIYLTEQGFALLRGNPVEAGNG